MKTNIIENISIRTASTVKQAKLIDELKPHIVKVNSLAESLIKMQIKDDAGLSIFEGNLKEAKIMSKGIKFVQDTLLEPLKTDMDLIKSAFNVPMEKLKDCIGKANNKLLEYKDAKAKKLRQEREAKEKIMEEEYNKKKVLLARIESIQRRMTAYLFGGTFPDKDGVIQSSQGCNNLKDCDNLLITIDNRFPVSSTFGEFSSDVDKIKVSTINNIYELKNIFEMINSLDEKTREDGLRKMNKLRADNQIETEYSIQKIEKKVENEASKKINELDKEIKDAKKNVRKSVKWEVTDKYRIPIQYLSVEKRNVDNFQSANLDKIKENIDSGNEHNNPSIPGIIFYYSETNISR